MGKKLEKQRAASVFVLSVVDGHLRISIHDRVIKGVLPLFVGYEKKEVGIEILEFLLSCLKNKKAGYGLVIALSEDDINEYKMAGRILSEVDLDVTGDGSWITVSGETE